MPYGTIKIDTVTFTDAGVDKSVTLSGLVQNPVFSGNVTVTGTLSGVTVTGTTASFTSGNFTNISGGTHTITSGVFAAGSAASPSITFTGDLNTGIYSPGADQVAISAGGSGRLFVDASGNVGVGTSTPNTVGYGGTVFGLYGAANNGGNIWLTSEATTAGNRTGRIGFGTEGNTSNKETARIWSLIEGSTAGNIGGNLVFNTKADGAGLTERLRITSAGLVGVGTSSPSSLTHINQNTADAGVLRLTSQWSSVAPLLVFERTAGAVAGALRYNDALAGMQLGTTTSHNFYVMTGGSNAITVDSSQRVGVGTSTPSYLLTASASSTSTTLNDPAHWTVAVQNAAAATANQFNSLLFRFNDGIYNGNSIISALRESGTGRQQSLVFAPSNSSGDPTERARIDSSGRLLVGTSNQDVGGAVAGVKLDPSGQVFASSDTAGLFYDNPFYGDRRNTAGDGPIYVLARQGYYKAAIGCTTGGGTANEGVLTFYTATNSGFNERARIDSSGRVGIGTSSPNLALHVSSGTAAGINNVAILKGGGSSSGNGAGLVLSPDSANTYNTWLGSRVATAFGGANWGCDLVLSTNNNSAADNLTERMRITSAGNVGIGTSPEAPLHVKATGGSTNSVNTGLIVNYESTGPTTSGGGTGIRFRGSSGGGGTANYDQAQIATNTTGSNNDHGLDFYTRRSAASGLIKRFSIDEYGGIRNYVVPGGGPVAVFGYESGEAARITNAGQLLVGTSSYSGNGKVAVAGNTGGNAGALDICWAGSRPTTAGTDIGYIRWYSADNSSSNAHYASIYATSDGDSSSGSDIPGRLVFSTTADGASSPTERMRITNNGYLKVSNNGTYINSASSYHEICTTTNNTVTLYTRSAAANGQQYGVLIETLNDQNDGTRYFLQGSGGGIERATLRSNGGLANYSANNVNLASDIRLKKDITPLATTWNKVKEIEVVNFRYKDCNENDPLLYGVIAQQVQPIVPELVVVTRKAQEAQDAELDDKGKIVKEAVEAAPEYYGIREQPMYWLAIKALQEAMERIEVLEQRLTDAGIA